MGLEEPKPSELNSQQEHAHKSTALVVTQERLDLMNTGKGKSISIEDRLTDDNEVCGTKVVVRIPDLG